MPNLGLDSEEVGALLSHIEQRSRAALADEARRPLVEMHPARK